MSKIKKVVIWGHKLHSHTHSYIHNGFYVAFKHLGYDTYWFDDNDDVSDFDFENTFFITEHQVDNHIPKRSDCLYLVHFIDHPGDVMGRYDCLPPKNVIELQVAYRDMYWQHSKRVKDLKPIKLLDDPDSHEYYFKNTKHYIYYTIWATDLLPHEIDHNIKDIRKILSKREPNMLYFVGSFTPDHACIIPYLNKHKIGFGKAGATFNIHSNLNMSIQDNMDIVQRSTISPAFQYGIQLKEQYIPCRIFKNISYGRMGITNHKFVSNLFQDRIIYDESPYVCFDKGLQFEEDTDIEAKTSRIINLMNFVKEKHTYVNRIQSIQYFIKRFTDFEL